MNIYNVYLIPHENILSRLLLIPVFGYCWENKNQNRNKSKKDHQMLFYLEVRVLGCILLM